VLLILDGELSVDKRSASATAQKKGVVERIGYATTAQAAEPTNSKPIGDAARQTVRSNECNT